MKAWHFLQSALVVLFFAKDVSALERCRPIETLKGINQEILALPSGRFYAGYEYFCSDDAPRQLHCQCGVDTICKNKTDAWGRNVGVCACCPWWMIVLFAILSVVAVAAISIALYVWCCRGKWWFDGYPPPVKAIMCRRGAATVVPATGPLPPNLFRGYRTSEFVSEPAEQTPLRVPLAARGGETPRYLYHENSRHASPPQNSSHSLQQRLSERNPLSHR
ncbi:hypothetical protein MOQ_002630 [Trypanosoma cruzi marinkellei]|uniref:Enriched in surface-labeled proteome protein 11 n=1 Tax=Trypanosoma cruzi marinkellei TaxID=85056 RepID=K2NXA4_TRYCR|nr:hypothetical protein MOQ_002630 [Trypanosoma cruzi marinkellei]